MRQPSERLMGRMTAPLVALTLLTLATLILPAAAEVRAGNAEPLFAVCGNLPCPEGEASRRVWVALAARITAAASIADAARRIDLAAGVYPLPYREAVSDSESLAMFGLRPGDAVLVLSPDRSARETTLAAIDALRVPKGGDDFTCRLRMSQDPAEDDPFGCDPGREGWKLCIAGAVAAALLPASSMALPTQDVGAEPAALVSPCWTSVQSAVVSDTLLALLGGAPSLQAVAVDLNGDGIGEPVVSVDTGREQYMAGRLLRRFAWCRLGPEGPCLLVPDASFEAGVVVDGRTYILWRVAACDTGDRAWAIWRVDAGSPTGVVCVACDWWHST